MLVLEGGTVREMLASLAERHPDLHRQLVNRKGNLHTYVHFFLDKDELPRENLLDTPVRDEAILRLVPGIAGG